MSTAGIGGFNPIHCLDCNLEVSPKRLGLTTDLIDAVAFWRSTYGAIDLLELNSGEYEAWAQAQLLDPSSAANVEGRAVSRDLNDVRRCYYWLWQPESHEGWTPRLTCLPDTPLESFRSFCASATDSFASDADVSAARQAVGRRRRRRQRGRPRGRDPLAYCTLFCTILQWRRCP
jgi:hypothetical protein